MGTLNGNDTLLGLGGGIYADYLSVGADNDDFYRTAMNDNSYIVKNVA